jgi:hypothetical protein
MNAEIEVRGPGGETVACVASFTPLPAYDARRAGFGVILYGLPVAMA